MRKQSVLPIFFATDDGYAAALAVALESLLQHASGRYAIRLHILTESLSEANRAALLATVGGRAETRFIDVKERIAPIADRLVLRDYYSSATYFRLFISELFPEYDKALYLDCDIVITGDVCDLYDTRLGNALLAAVPEDVMARFDVFGAYVEHALGIPRLEFFNAGVLVMNLDAFRRERILDRFIDLLSRRRFSVTQDEDYLNVLCYGKVRLLPYTWNTSPLAEERGELPHLIHYKLDRKPWHYDDVSFGRHFWHYAARTPYYEALLGTRAAFSEQDALRDRLSFERLCRLAAEETESALSLSRSSLFHAACIL